MPAVGGCQAMQDLFCQIPVSRKSLHSPANSISLPCVLSEFTSLNSVRKDQTRREWRWSFVSKENAASADQKSETQSFAREVGFPQKTGQPSKGHQQSRPVLANGSDVKRRTAWQTPAHRLGQGEKAETPNRTATSRQKRVLCHRDVIKRSYRCRRARSMSRCMVSFFIFSRLSNSFLPRQIPNNNLTRPRWKYIFSGTKVSPFS